jgi:hypothetical protein
MDGFARTNRSRQFNLRPTEVCDDLSHRARSQGRHRSDYERLKNCGFDRFVPSKVSFITPSWIDLERAKRMLPALRKVEGAAWPVHKSFAGDQILEIQAGLLY